MKKVILFLLVVLSISVTAQNAAEISFDKLIHNYGTIYQNGDGTCVFTITNKGNEVLVLSNVQANCGCTTPEWPEGPIVPGQTEVIKVKYDTRRLGTINKQITVMSNATQSRVTLKITGKVIAKPAEILPETTIEEGSSPAAH